MCNDYLKALEIDCSECPFFEPEAECIYNKEEFVKWLYYIIVTKPIEDYENSEQR